MSFNRNYGAVFGAVLALGPGTQAISQGQTGWFTVVDGLAVYQGSSNLSGGGSFSASRGFLRAGGIYRFGGGNSAGLFVSYGEFSYDFDFSGNQPWDDIRDVRVSAPLRFAIGGNASLFVSPQIRWDYQRGVDASDGRTYGAFAGISWRVNDRLEIGPAIGAFSQLSDDDTEIFPALLVNWKISDRATLSTGTGLGATQGPGLSLSYELTDAWDLSVSVRSERVRFRLDDTGLAPGGVGEDSSIPVVISVGYAPNPAVSFSAFAGAEFNGELKLDTASGVEVSRQSYDTAPIAGFAFRVRF